MNTSSSAAVLKSRVLKLLTANRTSVVEFETASSFAL